jgi:hypothetical protein
MFAPAGILISFRVMCGRYRRTTSEEELARLYHIPIPKQTDLPISYNIAPSQKVLIRLGNCRSAPFRATEELIKPKQKKTICLSLEATKCDWLIPEDILQMQYENLVQG